MLNWWDYLILGIIFFLSIIGGVGIVIYILFKKGIQYFKVVLHNDVGHFIDEQTDIVMKKVSNKMKSLNANRAKAAKQAARAAPGGGGGWMDIVGAVIQSPQGQQMIGNFLGNMIKKPPSGPSGPVAPP